MTASLSTASVSASSAATPSSAMPSLRTLTTALNLEALNAGSPANAAFAGPADFLRTNNVLCWIRRSEGLVAFGQVARFDCAGPERFADAEDWWRLLLTGATVNDPVKVPGTGALAFGSFAFSKTSAHVSSLIVPSVVVGFRDGVAWLTQLRTDDGPLTADTAHAQLVEFLASGDTDTNSVSTTAAAGLGADGTSAAGAAGELTTGSLSEEEWMASVAAGVRAIESGGLEKVVLARDIVAKLTAPIGRNQILARLAKQYDECWTYGVEGLVGSTPEMLIKVEGTTARARVLAGTLDREDAPADAAGFAATVLAGSAKQRQEHEFAVRSLTRQLAPFATDLSFPTEPFILELPNVWHLASDVYAELADVDGHLPTSLALVEALHPTAAVCGTPREAAGELILALEKMDRGPYAGPVGWLDSTGNGEWGIALRGAVVEDPQTVRMYAGAGIVEASDPAAELAETWAKFRPMLQALGLRG